MSMTGNLEDDPGIGIEVKGIGFVPTHDDRFVRIESGEYFWQYGNTAGATRHSRERKMLELMRAVDEHPDTDLLESGEDKRGIVPGIVIPHHPERSESGSQVHQFLTKRHDGRGMSGDVVTDEIYEVHFFLIDRVHRPADEVVISEVVVMKISHHGDL